MKKSQLKQIIKEEIHKILNEQNDDEYSAMDTAYDEHIDLLKSFITKVLNQNYDKTPINLGWSDSEGEDEIIINTKIYQKEPIIFTTIHNPEDGEVINYDYSNYEPLNLSPEDIKKILGLD